MLIISLHAAQLNEADMFIQCHEVKPKAEATASAVNAGHKIFKEMLMLKPNYSITIKTEAAYAGRTDTYSVVTVDNTITIIHEVGGFMNKNVKPESKTLSDTEYSSFLDSFKNIDFQKVFHESGALVGCDGWTLTVTSSNVMSGISVSLWCPSEDPEKPETTKLLKACNKVCNYFPEVIVNVYPDREEDAKAAEQILKELQEDAKKNSEIIDDANS